MDAKEVLFHELLDRVLDCSATDVQRQQMNEIVGTQPHYVREIVEQLRIHSLLQWHCEGRKSGGLADRHVKTKTPLPVPIPRGIAAMVQLPIRRWRFAAAILLMGCGLFALYRSHLVQLRPIAEIVDEQRVQWAQDNPALQNGKDVVTGKLAMLSGELTLRFRSGATVTVNGQVSMRIVSDMLVMLDRGQATAHVPQWAKGFTIKTESAEVIDQGTKFGIIASDDGTTEVVVFEGQVDLKSTYDTKSGPKRLTQGEGARIGQKGSIDRIIEIGRNSRGDRWTTSLPVDERSAFKSIRDNLHSADSSKFYTIIPRGLSDDAVAYVDRPHEWNGVTTDGLPQFLQRADYIRTFNETRYFAELRIVVEMAREADVYIFFDSRVAPPQWLRQQFENTKVQIGLDEGPWTPDDTKHTVGLGGGQSIDTVFNVWRRRCKPSETLTLGPLGRQLADCAMYGIAAQPVIKPQATPEDDRTQH